MTWPLHDGIWWKVEPAWKGERVAILGAGWSLQKVDPLWLKGWRLLAINYAWRFTMPDALVWTDETFGRGPEVADYVESFGGIMATIDGWSWRRWPDRVRYLMPAAVTGLEREPWKVARGKNSLHLALNVAYHLTGGQPRGPVVLLGCDMRRNPKNGRIHFYDEDAGRMPDPQYWSHAPVYRAIATQLAASGIEVVNATPGSALDAFPIADPKAALLGPEPPAPEPIPEPIPEPAAEPEQPAEPAIGGEQS